MSRDIAVLLSTYNGEKYLREQIESVLAQKNVKVTLYIRDDGSQDKTRAIVSEYEKKGKCISFKETNIGVTGSFYRLLKLAGKHSYYAFCDQDDVWNDDKLDVALNNLQGLYGEPALYYSKTMPVDQNLKPLFSEVDKRILHAFNLQELMLRNNAVGCTMVFNEKLRDFLLIRVPKRVIMHDHWVFAVCRAMGGQVIFDPKPHIKYRQHGNNEIGHKSKLKTKLKYSSFFQHRKIRSSMAKDILNFYADIMPNDNLTIVDNCANYKQTFKRRFVLISQEIGYAIGLKNKILFVIEVLIGVY